MSLRKENSGTNAASSESVRTGERAAAPAVYVALQRNEITLNGVLDQAQAYGWRLLDFEWNRWAAIDNCKPIGAIVTTPPEHPTTQHLLKLGCPVVRLDSDPHPQGKGLPEVALDKRSAGHLAAEHFAERKLGHVAYMGYRPQCTSQPLYQGFSERAKELGLECHLLSLQPPPAESDESACFEHVAVQAKAWLDRLPKPLGFFAYHDQLGMEIMSLCLCAGYAVPEDVAVLGYNNTRYLCKVGPVPLSSIDQNLAEHGRQAVHLLHRLLHGGRPESNTLLVPPVGVVERQSTNILAVPDPLVAAALRFMWKQLNQPISVADIAGEVGVCRRTLERAFRKHLNGSIKEELTQKRLNESRRLLRSTQMSVADIAHAVGLRSRDYFHEIFREQYGLTPGQYRRSAQQGQQL